MEKIFTQQELDQIAERVFEAYKTKNVSEIARLLNEKPANIHKYFSGINRITPLFFIQVSKQTRVSIHWLLTGEGEKYPQENESNEETVFAFVLRRGSKVPTLESVSPEVLAQIKVFLRKEKANERNKLPDG